MTEGRIIAADARAAMASLPPVSVDLSFWSPPYFVGKSYERDLTFESWSELLDDVMQAHARLIKPGGFVVVNIADILCFADPEMPRFMADNMRRKYVPVTRAMVEEAWAERPDASRKEIARVLGCSEQTVQRRLEGNNVRGGKYATPTKVFLTGTMLVDSAEEAGLYLYDRRIWRKDPCWANSRWHSNSYRAVDEFEYLYVFWKPGTTFYDRDRLTSEEWSEWGSRAVWDIPSVKRNDRHEAEFPELLAQRVIQLYSPEGGVVLDPFVGSGTTTAVAKRMGREWIGVERDPETAAMAEHRTRVSF